MRLLRRAQDTTPATGTTPAAPATDRVTSRS